MGWRGKARQRSEERGASLDRGLNPQSQAPHDTRHTFHSVHVEIFHTPDIRVARHRVGVINKDLSLPVLYEGQNRVITEFR